MSLITLRMRSAAVDANPARLRDSASPVLVLIALVASAVGAVAVLALGLLLVF
jgi:hypothetical protein